jgi:hypothetical protein
VKQKADVHIITAVGHRVNILGEAMVSFSWNAPSATSFGKIKCYVVKDLQVGMFIYANIILKLGLRDSPSLLAPVLYTARSKQTKLDDAQKSKHIADAARVKELREAAERKAARDNLEQAGAQRSTQNQKPRVTTNSLVGGSDTSPSSTGSSLTGFDHSRTTTPSDESTRSGTSMDSQRHRKISGSMGHGRSKAVDSLELRRK